MPLPPLAHLLIVLSPDHAPSHVARQADAADRAELALTLAFSLLLTFGWSVGASVINKTALAVHAGRHAAASYAMVLSLAQTLNFDWFDLIPFSSTTYNSTLNVIIALHFALIAALLFLLLASPSTLPARSATDVASPATSGTS